MFKVLKEGLEAVKEIGTKINDPQRKSFRSETSISKSNETAKLNQFN
jgi:hypothetical protein